MPNLPDLPGCPDRLKHPNRGLLESELGAGALSERPHLFSDACISLPRSECDQITAFVQAVTQLIDTPAYRAAVSARQAEALAPLPSGVCLAFDFHVGGDAPQLIEINTNAGGSLLVTLLERAWGEHVAADRAEAALLQMFLDEWAAWGSARPLTSIAIVDEVPEQQYLYPEFVRWQKLFEAHGIQALICAPEQLHCDERGRICYGDQTIDLLYNRLTDFSLSSEPCSAIRAAWLHQRAGQMHDTHATLVTPHPQAHALWADKRNLQWLSDPDALTAFGLSASQAAAICRCVPRTVSVTAAEGEQFWATRKQWFFKPQAGFGSRATYRGDKLTKRVFEEILQGATDGPVGYVAQTFAPPPEVMVTVPGAVEPVKLKYDLRVYAYAGQIQLLAARLYQGQTTNFRTPGGGFAPVRVV